MSMQAALDLDRSIRLAVGCAATLRDGSKAPVDVVVEDISRSGCLLRADVQLATGEAVSVGIPGLGMCHGTITRAEHPHYGCAFLRLISTDDIAAEDTGTIVVGAFSGRSDLAQLGGVSAAPEVRKFSLRLRFGLIIGTSVILWLPILATVKLFAAR